MQSACLQVPAQSPFCSARCSFTLWFLLSLTCFFPKLLYFMTLSFIHHCLLPEKAWETAMMPPLPQGCQDSALLPALAASPQSNQQRILE